MSTKTLLYRYPSYLQAINNIRQQILVTTGERTYPAAISNYSMEEPNYNTNEFHSTTETHAIRNIINQAKEIEKLQRDLKEYQRIVQAITKALENLRENESNIIQLRYFRKLTWTEIEEESGYSERHARRIAEMVLKDLDIELKHIKPII